MKFPWKQIDTKEVYKNPWMSVSEDRVIRPDGSEGIYGVIKKPEGCRVIALDDEQNIILIRISRYPIHKTVIETPAGKLKEGKTALQTAKEELYEETHMKARYWKLIGKTYWATGLANNYDNVFLATGLYGNEDIDKQDGDEGINDVFRVPVSEVKKMIISGEIECGITLASLSIFFAKYNL